MVTFSVGRCLLSVYVRSLSFHRDFHVVIVAVCFLGNMTSYFFFFFVLLTLREKIKKESGEGTAVCGFSNVSENRN